MVSLHCLFNCKPFTQSNLIIFLLLVCIISSSINKTNGQIITMSLPRFAFAFLLQLPEPSLFHIWHTVWLWLLLRLPALVGYPRPLLPPAPGLGQRCGYGRCQPLLHVPPGFPQQRGGTSGPQQDLPDPQPLHAGPGPAGPAVQTFTACWRRHGTPRHGSWPCRSPNPARGHCSGGQQVEQGPGWSQKVFQPPCVSHRDIPGVGVWSSHSCTGILCAIYPSGKNNNRHACSQITCTLCVCFCSWLSKLKTVQIF